MGQGRGPDRRKGRGERYEGLHEELLIPTEGLVSKGEEGAVRSVLCQAQDRPQGVHPLALCHRDRPYQEALPRQPSGRNVHLDLALCRKWAKKFRVATKRRSNSKNQSVEERLPKIQRFHKLLRGLMQSTAPVSRGSNGAGAGGVSGIAPPRAGESGGAGSGGASGERHAHANKKYGRFPLDRRVNVDQVRTRVEYIQSIYFICNNIRCIALFRMPSVVCFN